MQSLKCEAGVRSEFGFSQSVSKSCSRSIDCSMQLDSMKKEIKHDSCWTFSRLLRDGLKFNFLEGSVFEVFSPSWEARRTGSASRHSCENCLNGTCWGLPCRDLGSYITLQESLGMSNALPGQHRGLNKQVYTDLTLQGRTGGWRGSESR